MPTARARRPEQPRQAVGDRLHREHRLGAAAGIAFEQDRRAGIGDRPALGQHVRQRLRVAEAEVDTLAGQRMHAVRGVADEREPVRDGRRQPQERQRKAGRAA